MNLNLSLGELGRSAGRFEAVFFTLLHARVAGEETGGLLRWRAVRLVDQQEGAGDAVTDGAGLAGDAAADDLGDDIELAGSAGRDEGAGGRGA